MALVTVAVVVSHGFWERIVTLKVCRFVPSTGANVQETLPEVLGSPPRSIVRVPVHVPVTKDCCPEGVVGTGVPPPHVAARSDAATIAGSRTWMFIRALLRAVPARRVQIEG